METQVKRSRQREAILAELTSRTDHPNADMIYDAVRKKILNISLGTVYRNLAMLSESGIIMKISSSEGSDRYDGNPEPHYHFNCKKCGGVFDVHLPQLGEINEKAAPYVSGKITNHIIMFEGLCSECLNSD